MTKDPKSKAIAKPSVSDIKSLLNSQTSIGYWNNESIIKIYLETIEDKAVFNEVKDLVADQKELQNVWLTILALYILKSLY